MFIKKVDVYDVGKVPEEVVEENIPAEDLDKVRQNLSKASDSLQKTNFDSHLINFCFILKKKN